MTIRLRNKAADKALADKAAALERGDTLSTPHLTYHAVIRAQEYLQPDTRNSAYLDQIEKYVLAYLHEYDTNSTEQEGGNGRLPRTGDFRY